MIFNFWCYIRSPHVMNKTVFFFFFLPPVLITISAFEQKHKCLYVHEQVTENR